MTGQTVEYHVRCRFVEPPDDLSIPEENRIGDAMFEVLSLIEDLAIDQEIVSRTVLAGPDSPSRVRCVARSLDPTRHFATDLRWQVTTPEGSGVTLCSVACLLSWVIHEALPAAISEHSGTLTSEGGPARRAS